MPCISKCHYPDKWSKQNHVCNLSHFDQRSPNNTIYILEFDTKHDAFLDETVESPEPKHHRQMKVESNI